MIYTSGAIIEGSYRYLLSRVHHRIALADPAKPHLVVCMLNPSTADAMHDDPTIRRLREFAVSTGSSGLLVVNAYAFRSTNPDVMLKHCADPVGPRNDEYIRQAVGGAARVIVAWGKKCRTERALAVYALIRNAGAETVCWGVNKDGSPVHPLYLPKTAQLRPWSPP